MSRGTRRAAALLLSAALLLTGCGTSPVTAGRLQGSMAATFGRLYVRQQVELGNPRPTVAGLHSSAACLKGTVADVQRGAGDNWVCRVSFLVDGAATTVVASYAVSVQTNGCYAADGDGPAALNGAQTITGPGYRQVRNPLWLIDGCFDVG